MSSKNIDGVAALKTIDNQTLYQSIQTEVQQEIEDAGTSGVISSLSLADGTAAAPSLKFTNSPLSGIYSSGLNSVDVSIDNYNALDINKTLITANTDMTITRGNVNPVTLKMVSTNTGAGTAAARFTFETAANNRVGGILWGNTTTSTHGAYFGPRYNGGSAASVFVFQGSTTAWNADNAAGTGTGQDRLQIGIDTGQLQLSLGSATVPAVSFINDTNCGMWSSASDNIDFATNGVNRLNMSNTAITPTIPFLAPLGAVGAPSYSFTGDPNTGMYSSAADTLNLSTGGTSRVAVSTTAITPTLPFLAPLGTVGAPSYSFTGDPNTGMYSSAADTLNLSTGGTSRVAVSTTAITPTLPVLAPLGTVGAPSYSFTGDPNTGMYSSAADTINFACNGVSQMSITTSGVSFTSTPTLTISKLIIPISATPLSLNATIQTVTFDSPTTTVGSDLSFSSNTITCNTTGVYSISYSISGGTGSAASTVLLWLEINASGNVDGMFTTNYFTGASTSWGSSASTVVSLTATNTLRIKVNNVANTPAINSTNGGRWTIVRLL